MSPVSEDSHEWYQNQLARLEQKIQERDREVAEQKAQKRELEHESARLQGELANAVVQERVLLDRVARIEQELLRTRVRHQDQVPVETMNIVLRQVRGKAAQGFQKWHPMGYDRARDIAAEVFAPAFRVLKSEPENDELVP